MSVHWDNIEIALAIVGGTMISISTILNLLFMGRVTGLSGMLFSIVKIETKSGFLWKLSFVFGLISSVFILKAHMGDHALGVRVFDDFDNENKLDLPVWILGALLVGSGTN